MIVDELIEELKDARPGTEVKIEVDGNHINVAGTYVQKHTGILMITNSFAVYNED